VRGDASAPPRTPGRVAADSYEQAFGTGDGVLGDGVVPIAAALLAGATRQLELEGVLHAPASAAASRGLLPWYGSGAVVDVWLAAALEAAGAEERGGG
jgi:hypothetical protein